MKYKIILYLEKVVYSSDNIGRNFSLSFRLDDKTKDINVALSNGQTRLDVSVSKIFLIWLSFTFIIHNYICEKLHWQLVQMWLL